MPTNKPPVPHVIAGHALYPGLRAVAPLAETAGPPADIVSGSAVAATFASGTDGTTWTPPARGTDPAFGEYLSFRYDGTSGAYTQSCRFAGDPTTYISGTLFALVRPVLPFAGDAIFCRSGNGQNPGDLTLGCDPSGVFRAYLRVSPRAGDTPITLAAGKWYALAAAFESSTGLLTLYACNLTDGGPVQTSTTTLGDVSFTQVHSSGIWSIGQTFNVNYQGNFDVAAAGFSGSPTTGAATPGAVWDATAFGLFAADPYGVARPTLAASPTSVAAGIAGQAFTLASNVGTYTPGTPGSPVATASGATINAQTVSDTRTIALTIAGTGASGNTITFTDPAYQVSASVSVTSAGAADFTLAPPSPATGSIGAQSADFTLAPDGSYTGTAALADGGAGGTFTTAPSWSGESGAKTFRYTPNPSALAGPVTISATLPGLGTHSTTYTLAASALAGGWIARRAGTPGSVTMDGHAGYGAQPGVQAGGTAASGGQGALAYQWFQLPRADTPLTGSPGTLLAGQVGADMTLSGLAPYAEFCFVRRVIDGAGSVAWSNVEVVSTLVDMTIGVMPAGDSITAGFDLAEYEGTLRGLSNDTFLKFAFDGNAGVSASKSADWLPTATSPTVTGADSAARNLIDNALYLLSGISADRRILDFNIGINDVDTDYQTTAQAVADIAATAAYALAHGADQVVIGQPPEPIAGPYATPAHRAAIQDFRAALAALDNGSTIQVNSLAHMLTAGRVDYHDDGAGTILDPLHPNALGYKAHARARAHAVVAAVIQLMQPRPTAAGGAIIKSGQRRRGR